MQLDNNLDHNNLFVTGSNIKDLKKNTAGSFGTVIEWFFLTISNMTINPDKCKYGCMSKNSNDNDIFSLNEYIMKIARKKLF